MSEAKPARPTQVTVAAGIIMAGSVFVVLTAFEQIAGLRSIETQESVAKFLAEPPGDGLGLDVDGAISLLRLLGMVAAACAAATAILGYQVLQRSKSARLALAILAAPLFLTGLAAGGVMSAVVAVASVMLWFQPARDWFDGVTRSAPPVIPPMTPQAAAPVVQQSSTQTGMQTQTESPPRALALERGRPSAVGWACGLTWGFSGVVLLVVLVTVTVLAVAPDPLLAELNRQNPDLAEQGLTDDRIKLTTYAVGGVLALWCLAATLFAALALRRVRWAWVALLVSASLAGTVCVIGTLGNVLIGVPLAACIAATVLLARPDVRSWYSPPRG